jgi:hypothetical protein
MVRVLARPWRMVALARTDMRPGETRCLARVSVAVLSVIVIVRVVPRVMA